MSAPGRHTHARRALIVAALLYLSLTLLMLAPALPTFGWAIPGGPVARRDAWQNVWNLWWVAQALQTRQNPFVTPLLYYPEGADLALQTLNVSNGVLAAPVTALAGPVAGYNAIVVLSFTLAGVFAYMLALRVSGSRAGAFVAGLLFTFSPFHMTKLWDGQLELIAIQWLPLYALLLVRAAEDDRRGDALLAGVALALIGYTSWYYFLFSAVLSVVFTMLWLWRPAAERALTRLVTQFALVAVTAVVTLIPILLPALRAIGIGIGEGVPADDSGPNAVSFLKVIHSADIVDFWLPSALHPLWGAAVTRIGERVHPYIAAWNIAFGYLALVLGIVALAARRRESWRWWALALVGIVLALGPVLQVGGVNTGILLPYALLTHVPGVDIAHRPSHFVVIAIVALTPLVALGYAAIERRVAAAWRMPLLVVVVALGAFELLPPHWTLAASMPEPVYQALQGSSGALIDLPPRLESSAPLEAQMVHGLPMMGGFVSRTPAYPFAENTPVIRDLWALAPRDEVQVPSGADDALVVLNAYDFHHIVVHWNELTDAERESVSRVLERYLPGVRPAYADGALSMYVVPKTPLRSFAYFEDGWYNQEREGERRWRWMGARGTLALINPNRAAVVMRLTLVAQSYQDTRRVTFSMNGAPAGTWEIGTADTTVSLELLVPPGHNTLVLSAPSVLEQGPSQRQLSIVVVDSALR